MRNKANLLFIAVIAIPFYSFSSTTTITNLHTMQLQQQISRNAAVNSGVTTNNSKSVRSSGGGIPVHDAAAVEEAKHQLYEQWLKESDKQMVYEKWKEMILKEDNNE
ncbi:hypothetical protein U3B83_004662 [Klebsiella pneumoniae]|jgi:hypothetical protein|uniref:hypothetical protein n=1 Tax=Escherichia coli TaxID=562 RepID=UPI00111842C7|nr:hypothetical protein [Escherichia coli]EAO5333528.1 hypothetical protein [Salmonella enterica]EDM1516658.1 hypothetical protein [Salmonella enterica subsp. enterica serovar Typhimurium]EMA4480447.1 hypothetical protein [Klebsiella pneumoniae]EAU6826345.1 hypothetical protein [Salmonella enterica]EAV2170832.1 hypothetical protein [Salmonella enterica]